MAADVVFLADGGAWGWAARKLYMDKKDETQIDLFSTENPLGAGTGTAIRTLSEYKVLINYREPTYQRDRPPTPFRWTFIVTATSASHACDEAVAEFRRIERLSSVGWVREIVGVTNLD